MSNRIKLNSPAIASRADAENALAEIAQLTISQRKVQNDMDKAIVLVRERCEPQLTSIAKQIKEKTTLLEGWANANPDVFPKDRKSVDMAQGTIGYRTGMPKLALLRGKKWDGVLEILRSVFGGQYIRTKEDVAKDEIIAAAQSGPLNDAQLRQMGVEVKQDEDFFIKLNLTEPAEA